jgi:hypothetical protein
MLLLMGLDRCVREKMILGILLVVVEQALLKSMLVCIAEECDWGLQ